MSPKETSPLAIASLAFSCLGALTLGILTIPGIVCGIIAKRQVRRGEYAGRSLAQAGIIVGVAILILYLIIPAFLFGCFGMLKAVEFATNNLEITMGVTGVLIFFILLPFAFTAMSRRRSIRHFTALTELNRHRL